MKNGQKRSRMAKKVEDNISIYFFSHCFGFPSQIPLLFPLTDSIFIFFIIYSLSFITNIVIFLFIILSPFVNSWFMLFVC